MLREMKPINFVGCEVEGSTTNTGFFFLFFLVLQGRESHILLSLIVKREKNQSVRVFKLKTKPACCLSIARRGWGFEAEGKETKIYLGLSKEWLCRHVNQK